jgi:hypothetical protein
MALPPSDNTISNETLGPVKAVVCCSRTPALAWRKVYWSGPSRASRTSRFTRPKVAFILDIRRQNMICTPRRGAIFLKRRTSCPTSVALLPGCLYQAAWTIWRARASTPSSPTPMNRAHRGLRPRTLRVALRIEQ